MNLLLITLTTIDLMLALFILVIAVVIIKRQDKARYHYFLSKKRAQILRQFKEIYYSYEIYRVDYNQNSLLAVKEENVKQLLRNNFLGKDISFYERVDEENNVLKLQEKIRSLNNLADEFKVLYGEKKTLPIQSFIFWYRLLVHDFGVYKKNILEGRAGLLEDNIAIGKDINGIESCYKNLDDLSLLFRLDSEIEISKNR